MFRILLSRSFSHATPVTSLRRVRVMRDIFGHVGAAEDILEYCLP